MMNDPHRPAPLTRAGPRAGAAAAASPARRGARTPPPACADRGLLLVADGGEEPLPQRDELALGRGLRREQLHQPVGAVPVLGGGGVEEPAPRLRLVAGLGVQHAEVVHRVAVVLVRAAGEPAQRRLPVTSASASRPSVT